MMRSKLNKVQTYLGDRGGVEGPCMEVVETLHEDHLVNAHTRLKTLPTHNFVGSR